jgi:hypothetical protein
LENSENLCAAPSYATARLSGQNNAVEALKVRMGNDCRRRGHHHKRRGGKRRHR